MIFHGAKIQGASCKVSWQRPASRGRPNSCGQSATPCRQSEHRFKQVLNLNVWNSGSIEKHIKLSKLLQWIVERMLKTIDSGTIAPFKLHRMSSGQNYMLNAMPYTNWGRPPSAVRISALSDIGSKSMSYIVLALGRTPYLPTPAIAKAGTAWDHRRCGTGFSHSQFGGPQTFPGQGLRLRSFVSHTVRAIAAVCHAFLFEAFEAAIWHPCGSHEQFGPQHCVFTAVQGCHVAGFKTHICYPATPTNLPGSSVWNLFFSLAMWQPSNLSRIG